VSWNAADANLEAALAMGCWTPLTGFAREQRKAADWHVRLIDDDGSAFAVHQHGRPAAVVRWPMIGMHNVENGLAALVSAAGIGIAPEAAAAALGEFAGVRRRMELCGEVGGIRVYDDFAHHPTAIASTVDGLRRRAGDERIVAVLEPRSNTMRLGIHSAELPRALAKADRIWLYQPPGLDWKLDDVARGIGANAAVARDLPALIDALLAELRAGDHVLIMSNGGFGGLHERLLKALRLRSQ
jgi:UDP-N-acetylmuramate: L-alanyl-gamma-D-glutamyl-meso-diaminopimelate ligase